MTARIRTCAAVLSTVAALGGCSVLATRGDYADYRQVRLATDDRGRAIAMAHYVERHPKGHWAKQITAQRSDGEGAIYDNSKSTRDGLQFYLEAYPNGTFVQQARARLAALSVVVGRQHTEEQQARHIEQQRRHAMAEMRRTWLTRASQYWLKTLLGISNWGSPIAQVAQHNADFSRAFGESPRPRCSRTECIKFYQSDYAIPVPGATRIDREMKMLLRLRMDHGNVVRAEMLLPNKGFSRWYEQEHHAPVVDEDPQQRQGAITWALQRIMPTIHQALPHAHAVDVVPEPIESAHRARAERAGRGRVARPR